MRVLTSSVGNLMGRLFVSSHLPDLKVKSSPSTSNVSTITIACHPEFLTLSTHSDNQLASVQRQLNLYGFKCINRGDDKGAFFHPHFQRGHWGTAKKINRGPSRCNSSKKTVSSAVVTDEDSSSGSLMHELSSSAIPLRTIVTPSSVASHSAASSLNPLVSADPFLYVKQHLDVCQQQTY